MKVLFVSRSNASGGGASKAAIRTANGLRELGCDLTFWMLEGRPEAPWQKTPSRQFGRLINFTHRYSRRLFGAPTLPVETFALPLRPSWDVVHFHDTWLTVTPATIARLSHRQATFITFQDCSSFTGGCMYPWSCDHLESCGRCPQLGYERIAFDHTAGNLIAKRRQLKRTTVRSIGASHWIARQERRAAVFPTAATVIHNAADPKVFTPTRRVQARARFRLQGEQPTIFISAAHLADRRKNASAAMRALQRATADPIQILLAGHQAQLPELSQAKVVPLGYLQDESTMADALSAADLFLFPSLQDNCPLAVIESLCCGTPVVAYADSGGTPELIRPGVDGLLANYNNEADLVRATAAVLADLSPWRERRSQMAAAAAGRFSIAHNAAQHLELYREAIDARNRQL